MSTLIQLDKFNELRLSSVQEFSSTAHSMLAEFENKPLEFRKKHFGQSRGGGGVYLITSDSQPEYRGTILESIQGIPPADDFVLCLYRPHPIFNSVGELLKAREEVIGWIERMESAAPGSIRVRDLARSRNLQLQEFGTMQLIDYLKKLFLGTAKRVQVTSRS